MSPEQMRSAKQVDARSDIWALGTILFELLVNRPPFDGESLADLCSAVALDPTPSVRALRPDVPEGLERVIAWCLEKKPEARPATVAHLADALAPFGSERARASADRIAHVLHEPQGGASAKGSPRVEAAPEATTNAEVSAKPRTSPAGRVALVAASLAASFAVAAVVIVRLLGTPATDSGAAAPELSSATPLSDATPPVRMSSEHEGTAQHVAGTAVSADSAAPPTPVVRIGSLPSTAAQPSSSSSTAASSSPVPTPPSELHAEPFLDRH
jgi:serine/threonine-protein kinase